MKKLILATIAVLSFVSFGSAFAAEVQCREKVFSFSIEKNESLRVGTLSAAGQVLDRVQMFKRPVARPEYENLKAFYEGSDSEQVYRLYIFKETSAGVYVSFLEIEPVMDHKKLIEFRCILN